MFKQDFVFWKIRAKESPCELEVRWVVKGRGAAVSLATV
jgi:hypothetical protein